MIPVVCHFVARPQRRRAHGWMKEGERRLHENGVGLPGLAGRGFTNKAVPTAGAAGAVTIRDARIVEEGVLLLGVARALVVVLVLAAEAPDRLEDCHGLWSGERWCGVAQTQRDGLK